MGIKGLLRTAINKSPFLFRLKQEAEIHTKGALRGDPSKKSWSQFGEDGILCEELKDIMQTGFYVDVGANHPTKLSNTFKLYRMGMRGITVEPDTILSKLHGKYRGEDIQLCAASGERNGLAMFYRLDSHVLSTFSQEDCEASVQKGAVLLSRSLVPILTLDTVLSDCQIPGRPVFALLSVDTESWDEIVLRSNDWTKFRPRIVIFEDNDDNKVTLNFLSERGYVLISQNGCNRIMRLKTD